MAPAVHHAGADSAHAVPKIKDAYSLGITGTDPAESNHE